MQLFSSLNNESYTDKPLIWNTNAFAFDVVFTVMSLLPVWRSIKLIYHILPYIGPFSIAYNSQLCSLFSEKVICLQYQSNILFEIQHPILEPCVESTTNLFQNKKTVVKMDIGPTSSFIDKVEILFKLLTFLISFLNFHVQNLSKAKYFIGLFLMQWRKIRSCDAFSPPYFLRHDLLLQLVSANHLVILCAKIFKSKVSWKCVYYTIYMHI